MFDAVCSYPLASDLFTQVVHPSAPVVALGLASGHVRAIRLPSSNSASGPAPIPATNGALANGTKKLSSARRLSASSVDSCATIETQWQTRRHKGSCRALAFSADGERLVSTGMDGLVKIASAESGAVERKLLVPQQKLSSAVPAYDPPTSLAALTPDHLLLGTESGSLAVYDLRASGAAPSLGHVAVHADYVSSLAPLAPSTASTSGLPRQWASTGAATLAVTDLRRGVLARSEAADEELLCSVALSGFAAPTARRGSSGSNGAAAAGGGADERVLAGGAGGGLLLFGREGWAEARREPAGPAEPVGALCELPERVLGGRWGVAAGAEDGRVRIVAVGRHRGAQLRGELEHDRLEGVLGVGFEASEGRLITGGGTVVKVWRQKEEGEDEDEEEDEREQVPLPMTNGLGGRRTRVRLRSDDAPKVEDDDESSGEEDGKRKSKRRKKGKGRGSKQRSVTIADLD